MPIGGLPLELPRELLSLGRASLPLEVLPLRDICASLQWADIACVQRDKARADARLVLDGRNGRPLVRCQVCDVATDVTILWTKKWGWTWLGACTC